ncbi:homeobox protein prospero [Lasius niger]|uniref:Homeobox protein prospero n=1 Tax=Lasius niger TaxID=67767 RepID=A0A0J7NUM3_LASNI|nr:homeobox protein prospero [Lasius niger]
MTISLTAVNSSTLTPMHLRKAKLMFFWVRYPSSAVLKMYFPDIKFNKNNTAQLVKWFSNFRQTLSRKVACILTPQDYNWKSGGLFKNSPSCLTEDWRVRGRPVGVPFSEKA